MSEKKKSKKSYSKFHQYKFLLLIGCLVSLGAILLATKEQATTSLPSLTSTFEAKPLSPILTQEENTGTKTHIHKNQTGYAPFSIEYPSSWSLKTISSNKRNSTLSLTNKNYELRVNQVPTDGVLCIFEGELSENRPYILDLRNQQYTQIETELGSFRRFETEWKTGDPNRIMIGFCQNINGTYRSSSIGSISYIVPRNYDNTILEEMDNIIKTLQKAE